jgi:hypothetical protein
MIAAERLAVVADRREAAPHVAARGANTVVLALVVALQDLELRRVRGTVPTPLRIPSTR